MASNETAPVGLTACRACEAPTAGFGSAQVLGHVAVDYRRCGSCGMVMAIDPHWLEEAYSAAIAKLDIGLLDRCAILSNVTAMVLKAERLRGGTFLDWAGGYGTLTRMMRDRGYDFSHQDLMATNIFADGHEIEDFTGQRFDLVTAFEVLEHLVDPVSELAPVTATTDLFLTSTVLLPDPPPAPEDWWYYTLESGQHITFYTRESLDRLARRLGFDGVVSGTFVHLFHRGPVSPMTRAWLRSPAVAYVTGLGLSLTDRRKSLLDADVSQVKAEAAQRQVR